MQSKREVAYLMSGPAHLPYLVTSLYTLRQHYSGVVRVYAWEESYPLACYIGEDPQLRAEVYQVTPPYRKCKADPRGSNSQFYHKIALMQTLRSNCAVYLDADTLITGPLDGLFEAAEQYGFAATQFNDWTTAGPIVNGRICRLTDREGIDQHWVTQAATQRYPSVNGGVFACRPDSPVLPDWFEQTGKVLDLFIADETVLHPVTLKWQYGGAAKQATVLTDPIWNISPKCLPRSLDRAAVKIWHGHGDTFTRPDKSTIGYEMWWPVYQLALSLNLGRINDWRPRIWHRHLNKLEQRPALAVTAEDPGSGAAKPGVVG